MADFENELRALIAELDGRLRELAAYPQYDMFVPVAMPPADMGQIRAYEQYLGRALSPSYRAFLRLHNGYRHLAYPGDMLSIEDVMPGGHWHDLLVKWKKTSARYGATEVIDAIPIANMGQPNSWAFLDPKRINAKTGEFKVVEWEPEDSDDYSNIVKFLRECLETVRYGLAEAAGEAPSDDED